ncbi:MAG: trk/ktr system potassium uptake protein [Clostridiales bacterium]|jgi:trk system potassium uptake protein TrkA|uniref:TrkA family potassium uptake protein n=2 Tax=Fusibacter paucivorans TaxID=76009 RepID=A0ABS5PKF9_9FIRM|nr:TrkA family potassium uptake protein [Fusibacter paucivorans]MDK2868065.1 trk/ktr system potassium uptake protein [Clostridiales bacterium]MDN5298265.1 trk/ktr system potassium uptake protein [Clostridiales bacterium]
MKKQFVVVGCGRFGQSVAIKLAELGCEVMVVDRNEEIIQNISEKVTYAVQADATDENSIKALGIRNFDVAIVTIGSDIQSSILVTLLVKELGVKHIVAKAQNSSHAKVLYKIGANRVVFPEKEMGIKIAKNLVSGNVLDFIDLAPDYSILEISMNSEWIGKSLVQIDMRRRYQISVIAVRRGDEIDINAGPDKILLKDDILIVIGNNEDLKKIERQMS